MESLCTARPIKRGNYPVNSVEHLAMNYMTHDDLPVQRVNAEGDGKHGKKKGKNRLRNNITTVTHAIFYGRTIRIVRVRPPPVMCPDTHTARLCTL